MKSRGVLVRAIERGGFWFGLLLLLALTLLPIHASPRFLNDKVEHFVAFFILAILGLAGWGEKATLRVAVALTAVGAMIEILQAVPAIGRDAEVLDWMADIGGVCLALVVSTYMRRLLRSTARRQ